LRLGTVDFSSITDAVGLTEDEDEEEWVTNFHPNNWQPKPGQEENLEPSPVYHIDTGVYKYFKTYIDLLGIRHLDSGVSFPYLRLQSFWKEPMNIDLEWGEGRNININGKVPDDWKTFASKVEDFMRLVESLDDDEVQDKKAEEDGAKDEEASATSSMATDIGVDEFMGLRVKCPIYRTPVIEYLQRANFGPKHRFSVDDYRKSRTTD